MATVLWVLGIGLLALGCAFGLVSLIVGLPGTFIIVATALVYAWATDFAVMSWTTPAWLFGMAVVAEIIEFVAAAVGTGGADGQPSRRVTIATIAGAIVGGIIGTPFLFGIGSLLGAMAGAFVGAAMAVSSGGGTWRHSMQTGLVAMRGRLVGFVIKSAIAVAMILVVIAALL
jgi:hypothetical protein